MGQPTFDIDRRKSVEPTASVQTLPGRAVSSHRRKHTPLWHHFFGSLILCAAIIGAAVGYVSLYGDANDAIAKQRVMLNLPPQPAPFDNLNGTGSVLPDLLSEVAANTNPTEAMTEQPLDALGNPIDGLAGGGSSSVMAGQNPAETRQPSDLNAITINGQSINTGLIKAPAPGLSRTTPYGAIPARANDGRTAFKVYARPYTAAANLKPVSLVIGGLGINRTLTTQAINDLPPEITLSFAAHAPNLQNQINAARARGHEVLLELPMESEEFDPAEPGAEWALRARSATMAQNKRNLDRLLSRASGYFAVTNYNGGLFLQRSDSVVPMMAALSDAGLGFVFDGSVSAPSLPTLANASRLPYLKAFSLIDANPDTASIKAELDKMSSLASGGAAPVGVGFTYPQTIEAVSDWVKGLQDQGLALAPVSSRIPSQ